MELGRPVVPSAPAPTPALAPERRTAREVARSLAFWAPVWIPAVVLAQIAVLGLGPALREQRRLGRAERELSARYGRATEQRAELERWMRAQDDPIYIERERRRASSQPETPRD